MIRLALDIWAFAFLAGLAIAALIGIALLCWHARKLLLALAVLALVLAMPMVAITMLAALIVLPILTALAKLLARSLKRPPNLSGRSRRPGR